MKVQVSIAFLSAIASAHLLPLPSSDINSRTVQRGYGNSSSTAINNRANALNRNQDINVTTSQTGSGNNSATAIRNINRIPSGNNTRIIPRLLRVS